MQSYLLYLFLSQVILLASAGMTIISASNPNIVGYYEVVPNYFANNPKSWNISGELVPDWRARQMQDLSGKIIIVERPKLWIWDEIAMPLQEKGALGIISTPAPVFSTNEWYSITFSPWLLAWQIVLGFIGLAVFSAALYLIILFYKSSKKNMVIIRLSLWSHAFGTIWRTIFIVVNPLMFRRLWYAEVNDLFLTSHAVFTIAPIFLIALYQYDLMRKSNMQANAFLSKMKIPFWICIGVLFAAEIAISVVRSQGANTAVIYINILLYIAVALIFAVLFVVTSIRITLYLRRMQKIKFSENNNSVQKTATLLSLSSIFSLGFIVSLGFELSPMFLHPVPYTIIWFFVMLSLYGISAIHIATYFVNRRSILGLSKKISENMSSTSSGPKPSVSGPSAQV